jgi:hypothetical protein
MASARMVCGDLYAESLINRADELQPGDWRIAEGIWCVRWMRCVA